MTCPLATSLLPTLLPSSSKLSIISLHCINQNPSDSKARMVPLYHDGPWLKGYVLFSEFVGRFPVLVPFHSLTRAMLVRILTEPKNALIPQFQMLFGMDKVELSFTPEAMDAISQQAMDRKTGARGLRSIMENLLLDSMFEIPGSDIVSVHITAESVRGEAAPIFVHGQPVPSEEDQEEEQVLAQAK
ncbi:ATP-dependent Clp protease ATP-binding subunit clpX-like, mitochondrial [Portunus trituberculatus]|uniref:ATP-dependent Clp protease ATP-binding subunit clpX-like, mitochondrial n=1 Tax=Portunus trituberculatus TaxID=210409 RepID=A0A5B7FKD0_PORTR|nr:ATP-dependent Clp protease ATP-binding subunit clpX-like, mitochondrial [Portunus trituberculatus]